MTSDALTTLEDEVADTLKRTKEKRFRARRNSRNIFLAQASLVFAATICLGISWPAISLGLKNAALIFNSGAALAATISGYYNFRDRWIQHTRTEGELRALQGDLRIYRERSSAEQPVAPEIEDYRSRLRLILGESMQKWVGIPAAGVPEQGQLPGTATK